MRWDQPTGTRAAPHLAAGHLAQITRLYNAANCCTYVSTAPQKSLLPVAARPAPRTPKESSIRLEFYLEWILDCEQPMISVPSPPTWSARMSESSVYPDFKGNLNTASDPSRVTRFHSVFKINGRGVDGDEVYNYISILFTTQNILFFLARPSKLLEFTIRR